MRKHGIFAIALAAMVMAGCGSSDASFMSEVTTDMSAGSSKAAGVSVSYDNGMEEPGESTYAYDSIAEAAGEVSAYDEADEGELDPYYSVDDSKAGGATVDTSDTGDIAEVDTAKKIVRNMSYSVETTDLEALDQAIQSKVTELGGYIESCSKDGGVTYDDGYYLDDDGNTYYDTSYAGSSGKSRQYRYAYYTVRIPADRLDQFAQAVEEDSNVTYQSTYTQDITSSYVDKDSRRKTLEEELQILNNMMNKAETVEDMIQIESQISDVRYELERIRSQLKSMQDRVTYSTVDITVTEVTVLTDTSTRNLTWQERITNGFTTSCKRLISTSQELLIWIASNLPMIVFYLVLLVIALVVLRLLLIAVCVVLGIKRKKRGKAGKKDKNADVAADTKKDVTANKTQTADAAPVEAAPADEAAANAAEDKKD